MKFATLLAILSLTAALNTAYAETAGNDNEALAYCNNQAQLAGITDEDEKEQYIQECVDSFGAPSEQPGQ